MKRNIIFIMVLFFGVFLSNSCDKYEMGNPLPSTVADFSYEIDNEGYAPCTLTFINKSLNSQSYSWDFGNGQTSTELNPTTQYLTPGLYNVKLYCSPANDVHYNKLEKTLVINVKDPLAGLTQVLYYTTRSPDGGGVHMVVLNDEDPLVQDFEDTDMERPYGMAVDTANKKVYVTDYYVGAIYRFDADGKNPEKILDYNTPGALVYDPQGIMVIGDKLYYGQTGGLHQCNLDGTNDTLYYSNMPLPPEYPLDMHYDPATGLVYMVNDKLDNVGGFFTLNLETKVLQEIFPLIDGTAIEVNLETNKVYMAIYAVDGTVVIENGIYVCNTDGSGLAKIGDFGSKATWGMTMDHQRNKLFWGYKITSSGLDGKIIRSNLDGTGQEDWLTGISPHAMEVAWIKL